MVIRYLLRPGDAALVDDPGYYNLFGNLRLQGVTMLGVPRNPDGPDIAALEELAATHRPKVYFTQSAMQNPTGTDISPHAAFRLLQAAERHGFAIVEDDVFCDLQERPTPRLATLDQLNRVIYVRSFSKTLSGSLRVGFVACTERIASELADIKMLTSITTSQFTERLIYLMLMDGHYRKYLARLHTRLGEARIETVRAFEHIGLKLFAEPADGMFVWARFPNIEDSLPLAEASQSQGVMLAPGTVFRPHLERSPWLRFNVAVCAEPRVQSWLSELSCTSRRIDSDLNHRIGDERAVRHREHRVEIDRNQTFARLRREHRQPRQHLRQSAHINRRTAARTQQQRRTADRADHLLRHIHPERTAAEHHILHHLHEDPA